MRKVILCGALLLAGICVTLIHFASQPKFESIGAQDFAALIDSVQVNILDVRTREEHDEGHIPGTEFNIDVMGDSFVFQSRLLLAKDTPVALYCRSGNRSKSAAKLLAREGYKVYELSRGLNGWRAAGYAATDSLVEIDTSYEGLTIYYPKYSSINLVCQSISPENDKNAIYACAAAFTGQDGKVRGDYVSNGIVYPGNGGCYGCFVWYNNQWEFTSANDATAAMKRAQDNKGMGFRQDRLIHEGQKFGNRTPGKWVFRALCEKDGLLCITQSCEPMYINDFINLMHGAGIQYAIYLDMGGWAHSWYRKYKSADVTYIFESNHDGYTNWLTFYIN